MSHSRLNLFESNAQLVKVFVPMLRFKLRVSGVRVDQLNPKFDVRWGVKSFSSAAFSLGFSSALT